MRVVNLNPQIDGAKEPALRTKIMQGEPDDQLADSTAANSDESAGQSDRAAIGSDAPKCGAEPRTAHSDAPSAGA